MRGTTGGALMGLGQALMRRSAISRENELMARREQREDSLLARQESREDAREARREARSDFEFERQRAIVLAAEEREAARRAKERQEDRDFQREERGADRAFQRELQGEQTELMERRWDREDRRAIEEQAGAQLAAIDNRIVELRDMELKGEAFGNEGEIARQISELETQKLGVRSKLVERLFEMGDPRYKDLPADQRLYAAGYSKDQVVDMMRATQGASPDDAEEAAPTGRTDEEIAAEVRAAPADRAARYGLTASDRATLGLPPDEPAQDDPVAAMVAPESPPPVQSPRGRRRPPAAPDVIGKFREIASAAGTQGRPARASPRAPQSEARGAQEAPPSNEQKAAARVLQAIRSGGDVEPSDERVIRRMSPSELRKAGFSNEEIRKAQKLPPNRGGR